MKLSVITVCYNSENTIENTIKSVLHQKNDNVEYIIIDGKSSDGTLKIVNKYACNIDKFVSECDKGISDAFNKGISLASGDYIAIINSDDMFLPGAFEQFFSEINADTDVFFGNGIRLFQDGRCKKYMADKNVSTLHDCMSMVHPSTIVKRSAYEKYGVFNIEFRYVMDRDLLLRMLNAGAKFQYSEGFYSVYRMGGMSDKSYVKGVAPESYKIDIADGKSLLVAKKNYWMRIVKFYLIQIKHWINKADLNAVSLEDILNEIGKPGYDEWI